MHITPTGKRQHGPGLAVSLCREKKKLHAFFSHPDLGDPLRLVVVKNAAADRAEFGVLWSVRAKTYKCGRRACKVLLLNTFIRLLGTCYHGADGRVSDMDVADGRAIQRGAAPT